MSVTRILVVEDELIVATDLKNRLLLLGYEVAGMATTGEQAISLAAQLRPHLILMDIQLNGAMDGIAAAEQIRRELRLPVIFLTAYSESSTLEKAKMAQPFGYILKPFEDRELKTSIEMALYKHQAEAALQQSAEELAALNALGRAVSASLSVEQIAAASLEGMMNAVRFDLAIFMLRDGDTLILKDIYPRQAGARLGIVPEHRVGECLCGLAVREKKPIYSSNIFLDCRCTWDECKRAGLKSFVSLPLRSGEEIIGVIGLACDQERDFERQSGFLETLAGQVSVALTNARLFETAQRELAERKRAEQALRESEERYRSVFDGLPVGLCRVTPEGKFLTVNPALVNLLGFPSVESLLASNAIELYVDPQERQQRLETVAAGGTVGEYETRLRRYDGSLLWVRINGRTVRDAGGAIRFFETAIEDITQRRRAEEEREKLQAQLLQAQKMESVGRLAGGVAHDFNNMLQAILGNASLALEDAPADSPMRDNLLEIQKAAQRSADLTRQLLAFARKQTVRPKVLDLNDTVSGMLKMLRRLIGEDIQLAWLPGPHLWPVSMDPSQLDQVLANLTVNARDAMSVGGQITIETACVTLDDTYAKTHPDCLPGDYVMLSISDTGCGMDQEIQSHLFEPFFTTKDVGEGTGLGLATVYGIIRQNGGLINVYSEPGRGSTFKIYLPRAGELEKAPAEAAEKRSWRGDETVLLVEDEAQILNLGRRILQQQGYTVLAARLPEEALKLARQYAAPIHLLVTDVVMPGMNGRELREKVAALKPGLRCLFMSGYTANVIAHQGVLEQGIHFLQKPFTNDTLARSIREVLDAPHPPSK